MGLVPEAAHQVGGLHIEHAPLYVKLAFLGGPQDIGSQFDIGAIVVNGEAHAKLRNYWVKAMRTGDWMPIELPKTVIAPKLIRVTKTGH